MASAMTTPAPGLWPPSSHSSAPGGHVREQRARGQALHPRRPIDAGQAGFDRRGREPMPARAQRGDGGAGIGELVAAGQARRAAGRAGRRSSWKTRRPRSASRDPVAVAGEERRAEALGLALDHVATPPAAAAPTTTGRPRLMMPAFSPAMLGERVAEELLVVHRDRA